MLRIRKEQMETMSGYMLGSYISQIAELLRSRHKFRAGTTDEVIREWIGAIIRQAEQFGIRSAHNVEFFIDRKIEYGPEFPCGTHHAWARSILQDDSMNETEKLNRLNEHEIFGPGGALSQPPIQAV
jgi:hypothetical protein